MQSTREMLITVAQEAKYRLDKLRFAAYKAIMHAVNPGAILLCAEWDIQSVRPDGTIAARRHFYNVVTTAGKTALVSFLNSAVAGATACNLKYFAIGTGSTGAVIGDTALGTELAGGSYARVAGTASASTNVLTLTATFAANNPTTSNAVTEAGVLDASSVGNLFLRQTFSAINKAAADSLQISVAITFA